MGERSLEVAAIRVRERAGERQERRCGKREMGRKEVALV